MGDSVSDGAVHLKDESEGACLKETDALQVASNELGPQVGDAAVRIGQTDALQCFESLPQVESGPQDELDPQGGGAAVGPEQTGAGPVTSNELVPEGGDAARSDSSSVEEQQRRKRRRIAAACLALLIEEEDDFVGGINFTSALDRHRRAYEKEHAALVASISERLQSVPPANNEVEEMELHRLKRFAHTAVALSAVSATMEIKEVKARRISKQWLKPRSQEWWEEVSSPNFPADEWVRMFRASPPTFRYICNVIGDHVVKKNTRIRIPVPVHQRVASGLWRLATGEPLYVLAKRFGLGVSTCQKIGLDMCAAFSTAMLTDYIKWPAGEYLAQVTRGFEEICGIPKVAGVLYTTHISISSPRSALADYFNKRRTERFKGPSYSMAIQATVDHQGLFTDLCLGWPGAMTDEQILEKSSLNQRASSGALAGSIVLGCRSYPLKDWLIVPYPDSPNMPWVHQNFNERVADALAVAKRAFTRLKARWRLLSKRAEGKITDVPAIFGACCVLHNICEKRGEHFDPSWGQEVFDDFVEAVKKDEESPAAMQERETLAHLLPQPSEGWEHSDSMLA